MADGVPTTCVHNTISAPSAFALAPREVLQVFASQEDLRHGLTRSRSSLIVLAMRSPREANDTRKRG